MRLVFTIIIAGIAGSAATSVVGSFMKTDIKGVLRASYVKDPARTLAILADATSSCLPPAATAPLARQRVLAMAPRFVMVSLIEDDKQKKTALEQLTDTELKWMNASSKKEQDDFFKALANANFLRCIADKAVRGLKVSPPPTENMQLRGGI